MKKPIYQSFVTISIALLLILSGCSKSNQQAFSKRKYQPWFAKHHVKDFFKSDEKVRDQERTRERTATPSIEAIASHSPEPLLIASANNHDAMVMSQRKLETYEPVVNSAEAAPTLGNDPAPKDNEFKRSELRSLLKAAKENNAEPSDTEVMLLLLIILAVLLPPLAVFLVEGLNNIFLISLILTLLVWVPGVIFALLVIFGVV